MYYSYVYLHNRYLCIYIYDVYIHIHIQGGVISSVTEGKIIVDCATLSPERMMLSSQKITARYLYSYFHIYTCIYVYIHIYI
jgi:hypothetical protein